MSGTFAQIGIALDGERMSCVWLEGSSRQITNMECDASAAGIENALRTLLRNAPSVTRVNMTLCRPLLQACSVAMRGVSRSDAERVLARDWSRHIIPLRTAQQSVTIRPAKPGEWYAQFASHETMEALAKAAADYGWTQLTIRSIDDALAEGNDNTGRGERSEMRSAVICAENRPVHGAILSARRIVSGRRFLADSAAEDIIAFANSTIATDATTLSAARNALVEPQITLWGEPNSVKAVAAELNAKEYPAREMPLRGIEEASALDVAAICGMQSVSKAPMLAPARKVRDTHLMNRLALSCAAGIVLAVILGMGLIRIDTQRRLVSIERQRADLSANVRQAMSVRSQMEGAADVTHVLAQREANASRTNGALAQIARALPPSSALTAFTVMGDSITIEGEAPHSADVYNALHQLSILDGIRLAAPLRQDRSAADSVVERFSFSAVVRTPKQNSLAIK